MRRVLIVVAVLALGACRGDGDGGGGTADELPDVTVTPLVDGRPPLALGDLTGPAVVNLWATWCGPCRRELPAFQEVSVARTDVRFVGIDIGEDAADAQDFIDELGVSFEQFVDEDGGLTDALGVASLPVTLIVDADGNVATQHLGPMSADELGAAIDALPGP